jgi:hypothetical protein
LSDKLIKSVSQSSASEESGDEMSEDSKKSEDMAGG